MWENDTKPFLQDTHDTVHEDKHKRKLFVFIIFSIGTLIT